MTVRYPALSGALTLSVIPAKAGIHRSRCHMVNYRWACNEPQWTPAFAGVTDRNSQLLGRGPDATQASP